MWMGRYGDAATFGKLIMATLEAGEVGQANEVHGTRQTSLVLAKNLLRHCSHYGNY